LSARLSARCTRCVDRETNPLRHRLGLAGTLLSTASASAAGCPNTGVQVSGLSREQMESSIACLINEERTSRCLAALRPNAALRHAALGHSREMVGSGYFEHTSPAGVTFSDRIVATGYTRAARSWLLGENLVWGQGALSTPRRSSPLGWTARRIGRTC
jgi:uncharacterized protein YkwD